MRLAAFKFSIRKISLSA